MLQNNAVCYGDSKIAAHNFLHEGANILLTAPFEIIRPTSLFSPLLLLQTHLGDQWQPRLIQPESSLDPTSR